MDQLINRKLIGNFLDNRFIISVIFLAKMKNSNWVFDLLW